MRAAAKRLDITVRDLLDLVDQGELRWERADDGDLVIPVDALPADPSS